MAMRTMWRIGGVMTLLSLATACVPGSPLGSVDSVSIANNGIVTVTGWTFDPDRPRDALTVRITYDNGIFALPVFGAFDVRNDVGTTYPNAGAKHGYTAAFLLPFGQHEVCVTHLNYFGTEGADQTSCSIVNNANHVPVASLEIFGTNGPGKLRLAGWAVDPDSSAALRIHIYDGANRIGEVIANGNRPELATMFPGLGTNHGFDSTLTVGSGTKLICIYAVDQAGGPTSNTMGCKVFTF